jgi:hypothetical protein
MKTTLTPLRLIRVSARLMCILLFLLWGFVFASHLYWFFPPQPVPPLEVWFGQTIQLGLVVSYPLFFWKQKAASFSMAACALVFFFVIIGSGGAIAYFLLSVIPGILYLFENRLKKKKELSGL